MKPAFSLLKTPFYHSASGRGLHYTRNLSPWFTCWEFPAAQPGAKLSFKTGPHMSQGWAVWVEGSAWAVLICSRLTGTLCSEGAATPSTPGQRPGLGLLQAFSLWPEQGPPPQAPRAALWLQLGSPMRPGNCKSQRWHRCKALQHHIAVQESLSFLEQLPLLPGEVREHILEGHTALRWVQQGCHACRCHGHRGRIGAQRGGRPGQAHLGLRLTPEPRCKMMSNNNNRMTSNAWEAQAAVLGALGDRARVEACRNVQSRGRLANARREVSCPIDGDTVSRPRSRRWGVTAPMRCGDRPAT